MPLFDDTAKRRIRFQTRRGLLELDLMFKRFMSSHFDTLSDEELTILIDILALEDQPLLAIVNQSEPAPRADFEPLLTKIRNA